MIATFKHTNFIKYEDPKFIVFSIKNNQTSNIPLPILNNCHFRVSAQVRNNIDDSKKQN